MEGAQSVPFLETELHIVEYELEWSPKTGQNLPSIKNLPCLSQGGTVR
jgi:hypothetical protein